MFVGLHLHQSISLDELQQIAQDECRPVVRALLQKQLVLDRVFDHLILLIRRLQHH